MSTSQEETEAPLLNLVLECDRESSFMNDSFSTLGLHSIFSEDDLRNASKKHEQERASRRNTTGQALEKFLEESSACQDEMDLRTLLRKGGRNGHDSFTMGVEQQQKQPQFHGNRWLESAGKSVSCRNFGYDDKADASRIPPSQPSRLVHQTCREIVSQAIELTARGISPPPLMDVSGNSIESFALSEADDINDSNPDLCPSPKKMNRRDRWTSGVHVGMSQSCRHFNSRQDLSALNTVLPKQSSPDNRKTMLTMGKSLSSRNLGWESGRSSSPKRLAMKSKSVRHFNAREREQDLSPLALPLSPLKKSNKMSMGGSSRHLNCRDTTPTTPRGLITGMKSKSVRHFNVREKGKEASAPLTLPLSPLKRSNKMPVGGSTLSSSFRNLNCALTRNLNCALTPTSRSLGMKSKSVRHFSVRERGEDTTCSMPLSPLKRSNKMAVGPSILSPTQRNLGTKSKSVRHFSVREREQEEDSAVPLSPLKRSAIKKQRDQGQAAQATFNGRKFLSYSRSLSCRELETEDAANRSRWPTTSKESLSPRKRGHRRTKTVEGLTAPQEPGSLEESKPKSRQCSATFKSLASFLEKRVESERIALAKEAAPCNRRSLMAQSARSLSARQMVDGRKTMLSFGKSLSARNLMDGDDAGAVPDLSPIAASTPLASSHLSVCQEESSRNEMDDSSPTSSDLSVCQEESSRNEMDDSLPGLSPMTPKKTLVSATRPSSSLAPSLPVVEEKLATEVISSPPLTSCDSVAETSVPSATESDGAEEKETASAESPAVEEAKPVFSTEEIRKEIGSIMDVATPGDVLLPIREAGVKSPKALRRTSRRSSASKEAAKKPSSSKSSLKAALHKSVKAASPDRRQSPSKSKPSALRASSLGSKPFSKPSSLRTSSHDSKSSAKSSRSKDGPNKSVRRTSMDGKSDRRLSASTRTSSHGSKRSSLRVSSHDSKPSSLKAAIGKSSNPGIDSSCQGTKSSSKRRLSSSNKQHRNGIKKDDKQRSSRKLMKNDSHKSLSVSTRGCSYGLKKDDKQRSSRNLIKKNSQKSLSVSSQQRTSTGGSDKNLSASVQASSTCRKSSRSSADKALSSHASSSRNHKKPRQRSSRKLLQEEPHDDGHSSSTRGLGKKEGSRRDLHKRRSSRTLNESRAESPSCVAQYSAGEKETPSPKHMKQVKEPSRKKRESAPKMPKKLGRSIRRSLTWSEETLKDDEVARFGKSLSHIVAPKRSSCSRNHCSWSATDFSAMVW